MVADPLEFANTYEEVHAIWFGFTDATLGYAPGDPDMPESLDEPHYYRLGMVIGKLVIFGLGILAGLLIIS